MIGYMCGVGEVVDMGDDVESGVAGLFKGNRVNGGIGRGRGEVQGPEAVLGCLAAGKERGGFGGCVEGDGGVGEGGGTVGSHEGGDGEEVMVEVGVRACEARDRVGVVGKTEGAAGGSPKDSAVGEVKRGRGDETRGEERGEVTERGGTEKDVCGAGIREEGGTRDRSRKDGGGRRG